MDNNKGRQYEALAGVYDEFMQDVDYGRWAEYILSLMGESCNNLIEYGCGTGNITVHLAGKGLDIIAVDHSQEMLNVAGDKLRGNALAPVLVCADMTEFRLNREVDCAVCACDGVNYILDGKGLRRFFKNVYSNLRDGGVFVFDISSEYKLKKILGNEFFYDDREDRTVFWQNRLDENAGIVDMELTLFLEERGVYKRYDEIHRQRAWSLDEINGALQHAGFSKTSCYSFGTYKYPAGGEERIQFKAIAEKRSAVK